MDSLQPWVHTSQRNGSRLRRLGTLPVALAALAAVAWCDGIAWAQFGRVQIIDGRMPGEQDPVAGVYLPTDRALSRAIARARERLAAREYHEALGFLHGVLSRDEDSFLELPDSERAQRGLKATARRLIGELPAEGLEAYELLHGATARRQLEVALAAGDQNAVAKVVRQFYHTSAGHEAALVLAQMEADQGHRLAAAQLYQELLDTPRAAARFEPQLSVLAAMNRWAAGDADAAEIILSALLERRASEQITLSGKSITLPAAGSDFVAWLERYLGKPSENTLDTTSWLTHRGNAARSRRVAGGQPHLRARWQARIINDPTLETSLSDRLNDLTQRGTVVIPAARPIALGDVVVMRTPENIVAVDWQTGKRIWETRDDTELTATETPNTRRRIEQQWAEQANPLEDRIWDDALAMSLSSDGERVFVLRGLPAPEEETAMGWQIAPGWGRFGGEMAAATNQLVAYDLATQGKLVWELDGSRTGGPLDGAFFLGTPLAIDSTLYVMAEIRSALYLVALDPPTGTVRWQQQLVGLEQGISLDRPRRRAGATPSYDGGILVCPTAASAVVGIDVVKREFAWVYRYPREPQFAAEARNQWQNIGQPNMPRENNRWLDNSPIIADGHVFLTPQESAELYCIDLHTGKLHWKQRRGEALFIGAVDGEHVLLVGADKVQALRVADGMWAWEKESTPLPSGTLPAGQGYLSDGRYYLPLTSGQIASIELATGKLDTFDAAQPDLALGNLVCYRGSVLSQSSLMLDKFEQFHALQQRAEAALAKNPNDPTALRELAELKQSEGDVAASIKLLKRAVELAPDDPLAQEMLAELLLNALASDYEAYYEDVPLARRLIRTPQQQIELSRIEAGGMEKLGQRLAAWDAYLRLADFTAEEPSYLKIEPAYRARSDHWIAGRLHELWKNASAAERKQLAARLESRRPSLKDPRTTAELRHYLAHMDQLPGAAEVRLALARLLIERARPLEAEFELLQLVNSQDGQLSSTAAGLLTELETSTHAAAHREQQPWPDGHVDVKLLPMGSTPPEIISARSRAEGQTGYRQLRLEQDSWPGAAPLQWFASMDSSELVGRGRGGDDVFRLAVDQNTLMPQLRDSGLAYAARVGHVLYVWLGGRLLAIDSRHRTPRIEGDLLWQSEAGMRVVTERGSRRRAISAAYLQTNRRAVYHSWSKRQRMAVAVGPGVTALGPATPRGVVFQESGELKCVDPLSGELVWARGDVPAGCELLGDEELVIAADVNGRVAYVYRITDGSFVGQRELPRHEWLLTAGRNIAHLGFETSGASRKLALSIVDLWSQDVLFEAEYPLGSRLSVAEPHAIAVYDPPGKFQYIDVRTGRVVINRDLEPLPDLQFVETMRSGDELYLFVSGQVHQQVKPVAQFDYPVINGLVYAFNVETGEPLWPSAAVVRNRGIVLSQPEDIPLLVFAERRMTRDANTGGGAELRVLCLDKRTGQTVYRSDHLPDTSLTRFRIRAEHGVEPAVALEMSMGKIQLTMTDRPRPPQPPANDDLETPRESEDRGLRGIGRRVTGALRGVLGGPAEGNVPAVPPNDAVPQNDVEEPDDD